MGDVCVRVCVLWYDIGDWIPNPVSKNVETSPVNRNRARSCVKPRLTRNGTKETCPMMKVRNFNWLRESFVHFDASKGVKGEKCLKETAVGTTVVI